MSQEDQIAQFIATRGVTKCPPSKTGARSLHSVRREFEFNLMNPEAPEDDSAYREAFGRARANGASISEALDEAAFSA